MSKSWLLILSMALVLSGCGTDNTTISHPSSEKISDEDAEMQLMGTEALNINFSEIDNKTPPGEHIVKVLYSAGTKRVYLLKNGTQETRIAGTRAWRNNNEGNLEFGKFAKKHYALGKDPRFAIFPSEYLGFKAKETLIFKAKSYRNLPLFKAIHRYAPSVENNTTWYYRTVRAAAGSEKIMGQYDDIERKRIIHAMRKVEGWRKGKVYREPPKKHSQCYRRELC